jgi:hypothetical protein
MTLVKHLSSIVNLLSAAAALWLGSSSAAQQQVPAKVEIAWNRFYNYDENTELLRKLVAAYPELLTLQSIGKSEQGRDMWLVTLNNLKTGPESDKPAMWIDGNVHGNEIQASETVIYSIWYLSKSYGQVESLTKLMDRCAFYFLPSVNPDGRANWFAKPTTPHDYRTGLRPTDNDYDGLKDEDDDDDLNGDGHIGVMWRADPNGTHVRNRFDPRIFERVEPGQKGDWIFAGSEGIDNDGDGSINEDGAGGYDMNRNWPSDWQANFVQFGAGEAPLDRPETKAVAQFILAHPNIAAGQSYHNAGGMILRGPGAAYLEDNFPRNDLNVYDRLARAGEEMLPFYRYLIIHSGLYTVHGGFVNWLAEGLGIVSFTNELWTDSRIAPHRPGEGDDKSRMRWQDRVLFGQTFSTWTEFDHPTLGKVLIGGGNKWSSRIPPPFMLEEECHRNFAFTMFHADNMPLLSFNWIEVKPLGPDVWQITFEIDNVKIIPTRTGRAAQKRIGLPDQVVLGGEGVTVLTSGTLDNRIDKTIEPVDYRKHIIFNDRGIPGEGQRVFRAIVSGRTGTKVALTYKTDKARDIQTEIELKEWTFQKPREVGK